MSATILIASVLLAQGATPAITVTGDTNTVQTERVDVAYDQLRDGRNADAITRITGNRELATDDPAAMINLGAAYVRMGRDTDARRCYNRAIASREQYDLELASGEWMNSRQAARKATTLLRTRQTLALAARQ